MIYSMCAQKDGKCMPDCPDIHRQGLPSLFTGKLPPFIPPGPQQGPRENKNDVDSHTIRTTARASLTLINKLEAALIKQAALTDAALARRKRCSYL
jgi:hypothetical protein